MQKRAHVLSGLDRVSTVDELLKGRRVGLMTAPTGVDHDLRSGIDILNERYRLTALFAVEHGIRGDAQAGARIDERATDPATGVTVYAAYGDNDHFSDEMLDAFDVLVFDIQDVGARFYTYLYSLSYAMMACARANKPLVVLDRVNPVGGRRLCGTILDLACASFVGDYELPTQYALTIGEYARYVKDYLRLDVALTVVPLSGWSRDMYLDDTDLPWVAPSPNCASLSAALCYTGTCIFEGSNLSEGRGTTLPFELIGAPWVDGAALEKRMAALALPGVHFRRASFTPTFSKHAGELCHGVQMHVTDREAYNPFEDGLLLMDTIRAMYPERFEFIRWSENADPSIDRLLGTNEYRTGKLTARGLIESHAPRVAAFGESAKRYHLYR